MSTEVKVAVCGTVGSFFGVGVCSILLFWLCRRGQRKRMADLEAKEEARLQERLQQSFDCISSLGYPMVLIPSSTFYKMTKEQLRDLHESSRDRGELKFLDTIEDIVAFKLSGFRVLFYSYEWLSWSCSGPSDVQLVSMKAALSDLAKDEYISLDQFMASTCVWLDILAIPQKHVQSKRLAVNSLYCYAAAADIFVVIAPTDIHQGTQQPHGQETYKLRVWTRVEQLTRACYRGITDMYLKTDETLQELTLDWVTECLYIFHGDMTCCRRGHPAGQRCDKEGLVSPILGMWFDLCVRATQRMLDEDAQILYDTMQADTDSIFPATFRYTKEAGDSEVRELFGHLIDKIGAYVYRDLADLQSVICGHKLAASRISLLRTPSIPVSACTSVPSVGRCESLPLGGCHENVSSEPVSNKELWNADFFLCPDEEHLETLRSPPVCGASLSAWSRRCTF